MTFFSTTRRPTLIEIDLDALKKNITWLETKINKQLLCPMIKANAYGHGAVQVAQILEQSGIQRMGVCLVEEGIELRAAGIQKEILVFQGFDANAAVELKPYNLSNVVNSWEILDSFSEGKEFPKFWLEFDTGMQRMGFPFDDAEKVFLKIKKVLPQLQGILTHFSHGENFPNTDCEQQLQKFKSIENKFQQNFPNHKTQFQIFNSGSLSGETQQPKWGARPGLLIYGVDPTGRHSKSLQSVMNFKSQVQLFRHLKKGDRVSYSGTWTAPKDSLIAVVPAGYADGYPRHCSNRGNILVNGMSASIVGNICMDFFMVDVTAMQNQLQSAKHPEVLLWGTSGDKKIDVTQVAEWAGTVPHAVLAGVGNRVPKVYKGLQ